MLEKPAEFPLLLVQRPPVADPVRVAVTVAVPSEQMDCAVLSRLTPDAEFTMTVVVPGADGHPPKRVTVTLYVPAMAVVALVETVGFWALDVNPFGPVQL